MPPISRPSGVSGVETRSPSGEPVVDQDLIRKRFQVGLIALGCLITAAAAGVTGQFETAWASAFLRIGTVFGALWLALPTKTRPAAWARLSGGRLLMLLLVAVLLPRLKIVLPVLLAGMLIGWLISLFFRRSAR